jgi:D-amino-acid dehydrogenase
LLFCFFDESNAAHVLEELEAVAGLGYRPVELDAGDVRGMEPCVSTGVRAGIYLEEERQVRPESLVTGYLKRLLDEGVDVRVASPIGGFEVDRGRVTAARNGHDVIEGDEFVIAAGVHSGRLARSVGARIPIDAGKGYSLHYEPEPVTLSHALYLYEPRVGVTPFDRSVRLAGTMEFSGINKRLEPTRVAAIAAAAERYIEGWPREADGRAWTGMRPMTPDGLPVIGRIADNVTIASGHAMLGVTLAPVTGDLVARSIADGEPPAVLGPFDPLRFTRRS